MVRADYAALVARLQPAIERFERLVRPRAFWLASEWAKVPIGLICLVLVMIITLPIPLGNGAPDSAICLLALGMMERDGVVIGRVYRRRARCRDCNLCIGRRGERRASVVYRPTPSKRRSRLWTRRAGAARCRYRHLSCSPVKSSRMRKRVRRSACDKCWEILGVEARRISFLGNPARGRPRILPRTGEGDRFRLVFGL